MLLQLFSDCHRREQFLGALIIYVTSIVPSRDVLGCRDIIQKQNIHTWQIFGGTLPGNNFHGCLQQLKSQKPLKNELNRRKTAIIAIIAK
jgi:hypothetical protein